MDVGDEFLRLFLRMYDLVQPFLYLYGSRGWRSVLVGSPVAVRSFSRRSRRGGEEVVPFLVVAFSDRLVGPRPYEGSQWVPSAAPSSRVASIV